MLHGLIGGRVPGQLVVQYTDHCNASCPQCGMRRTATFHRSLLGTDRAKSVIDQAAGNGVQSMSFTGGEPLLFLDDIVDLLGYANRAGIRYLRTGTNGFLFCDAESPEFAARIERIAARLAETNLHTFWISIDSAHPDLHERMRGFPGVIRGIEKALPIFHRHGIYPAANLGLNRNMGKRRLGAGLTPEDCREACGQFYDFVLGLGFTMANACYPMSAEGIPELNAVYAATADADLVRFTPAEKVTLFGALSETIPSYRGRLRIFTPRCSLHALARDYGRDGGHSYPCRGGRDFFFVDAGEGKLYPCGYRGLEALAGFLPLSGTGPADAAECRKCDWECFRDPSELLGPLLDLFSAPFRLLRRVVRDPVFFSLWQEDLRYYRACGFFDGRVAPNYRSLEGFAPPGQRRKI
jgi:MoaA/NifB/PqqE/SkfB family radical SAM enzyme